MSQVESTEELLAAGRRALEQGRWADARTCFEQARAREDSAEAYEGLSWAAWWLEDVATCLATREAAYRRYRRSGDDQGAARLALWLGDDHLEFLGEEAVAAGWSARAARLLEALGPCPEQGWLAAFAGHAQLVGGGLEKAERSAEEARQLGRALGAVDLEMFAVALLGAIKVERGDVGSGMACLDEAVVAALAGEYENLAPAAWACCLLMSSCELVRDFPRGAQWCRRIEAYSQRMGTRFVTGVCRAHQGSILTARGAWEDSERALTTALLDLSEMRRWWRGEAVVRLGELRRRQGRPGEALELFDEVPDHPLGQLGTAAVLLGRGEPAAARDLLRRLLRQGPAGRVGRIGAVELLVGAELAMGDVAAAEEALDELTSLARAMTTPPLGAAVAHCAGLVSAARGDLDSSRRWLEDAVDGFSRAGMPFEAACARTALGATLAAADRPGDADRELRSAQRVLEALGAGGEAERTRSQRRALGAEERDEALTPRQLQVLRLVADGLSDQQIAERLVLSEHTVHRHLSNIYTRLGCSTRAAAVARAGRLGLL
jgi:LuxR family transcriptional regulator, maltose regulon positive regulatory protein